LDSAINLCAVWEFKLPADYSAVNAGVLALLPDPPKLAAVRAPHAVRAALHRVERDPGAAVGIGHAHRLHELVVIIERDRRVERDAARPVETSTATTSRRFA
jgi:hypothetical protein